MKEVKITLNVVEINTVIKALGQFPYNQVNEIIAKIHQQASSQLTPENGQHAQTEKPGNTTITN